MERGFNCVEFVQSIILSELDKHREGGVAAELVDEHLRLFGEYDTYSLVYTDAYAEINDLLATDTSEELTYFIRRCTFMAARQLAENYDTTETLTCLLNKGIKAGIESLSAFFTDDDRANCRVMDKVTFGLPAIMVALIGEVLASTHGELVDEEDTEGTVSA